MKSLTSVVVGGGILAAVGAYLLRLRKTSAELETVVSAKLHSLTLSGITIRIDVQIKNPTRSSLGIKFPFVKLLYKGATVGSSQAINKDITIPSFGEVMVDDIKITIPILGLFSIGSDLVKAIKGAQDGISVQIKTITTIDLGWKTIPYEKMDEVVIKRES